MANLMALIAKAKARVAAQQAAAAEAQPAMTATATTISQAVQNAISTTDSQGIIYNEQQLAIIQMAQALRSCVLIGAAGTGKTTTMKAVLTGLIQTYALPTMDDVASHKHLKAAQAHPGIMICSYTRRAVANIRKNLPVDLQANCVTLHAALEYGPVYYDIVDEATGGMRSTMRFEASRNALRFISHDIRVVVFEEASMIGTDIHQQIIDALPPGVMCIYLGDIQQLPPVFGKAVLGYKMRELPLVELTHVYRQALDSPIISLAHRILSGKVIPSQELKTLANDKLHIRVIEKKLRAEDITPRMAAFLIKQYDAGLLNFTDSTVLIPFNKGLGTLEINRHIATHIARKEGAVVHEVIAGFNKHYFRIGERVLYNKEDAIVTDIVHNGSYAGKRPQPASDKLDYWGDTLSNEKVHWEDTVEDVDSTLSALTADKEERKAAASHSIKLRLEHSAEEISLDSAAEINATLLGYSITVHKSQGSEWRKVYLILHQSHATMLSRELLYTAVTRAKEELYIVCESDTFVKGINNQRIPGNTLEEKIRNFIGE